MKLKIGMDDATRSQIIGSCVIAMVIINPGSMRRLNSLGVKDSKQLTREKRDMIVTHMLKNKIVEHYYVARISPDMITGEHNLNDLEMKAMIESLNTYPEFWKNEIYINNFDVSRPAFFERLFKFTPRNLRRNTDMQIDKWTVIPDCDKKHKVCSLASIFAKHFSDLEYDDIRRVYGDFGTGDPSDITTKTFVLNNPDCPHIRKAHKDIINLGSVEHAKQNKETRKEIQSKAEIRG